MSISFMQPETFDPSEYLTSPKLRPRFDDARYLISLILQKFARRDVDDRGLVRLMAAHLRGIMYQGTCKAVIDALRHGGAIERYPYTVGCKSFGYRLASRFVEDRHVRVPATDRRLIRRLERFHAQAALESDERMQPIHRHLAMQQTRLDIHGAEARKTLESLPKRCNPYDCQGIQIANIEDGIHHLNVGRYGRVSNDITNIKRELRTSLHSEGERLVSVDIRCAQPALLGKLMRETEAQQERRETKESKYDDSFGDDLDLYVSLVQSGQFYEFLLNDLRSHDIGRDEVKRRFLADVIAKKGRYPSFVEDRFRQRFTTVYQYVRNVNRSDHATLIRMLQRAESEFVIETVALDFITRNPSEFIIPLHDSLFTTSRNLPALQQAFHRSFELTGFPMRLKVETS